MAPDVAALTRRDVQLVIHDFDPESDAYTEKFGRKLPVDITFAEADPADYVGLVIPGGRAPEYIRTDPDVRRITEYFFERNYAIPTVLAVRTEKAKLIKYPGHDDWTELFDLAADPHHDAAATNAQRRIQPEIDKVFADASTDAVGRLEVVRQQTAIHVRGNISALMLGIVTASLKL